VLSAQQIFNPDMSCLNYSGAHKPFIRITGEIVGLICKSHISKDLGGSFRFPVEGHKVAFQESCVSGTDEFKRELFS
jgi:hypothetical protein